MYDAPHWVESTFMEFAMPPATGSFSKTVTVNLSGCFDRAYAAERPAAPAPTMGTRWVFMVESEKKLFVQREGKERQGIQLHRSKDVIVALEHKQAQSRHVQVGVGSE
jgi:hypothetical protein